MTVSGNMTRQRAPQRPRLQSETLARRAYNHLEEMILTLELAPGSIVTEGDLVRRTGMGRTPLREALLRLGREKLVDILPRRGIIVSDINLAQYLSLLEARRVLDRLIAEKAAKRATPAQREELLRLASESGKEAIRSDIAEFMRLDRTIDRVVESAARSLFAVEAVRPMHAHCRRFWYVYQQHGDLATAAGFHARLIRAVASGKESAAGRASDELVDYLDRFTRKTLDQL